MNNFSKVFLPTLIFWLKYVKYGKSVLNSRQYISLHGEKKFTGWANRIVDGRMYKLFLLPQENISSFVDSTKNFVRATKILLR